MSVRHRVLLADDEPLARERLRLLLAPHAGYDVIAECSNGDDALAVIEQQRPDLVFLDIRMPGRTGVEVAQELVDRPEAPVIVFVTAYDEFSLKAFEVSAIDYLVKPVDIGRFDRTLDRVGQRLRGAAPPPVSAVVRALLEELSAGPRRVQRFLIRSARGHYFVRVDDIESATAEGNYIALAAAGRPHLIRETMRSFELKVDPERFMRIHRSNIVNIDRIARIEALGHSEYRVTMKSGARFESSRSYAARFRALDD